MDIYTVKDIAAIFKISTKTVYRLLDSGAIKYIQVGKQRRITREALETFIAERGNEC